MVCGTWASSMSTWAVSTTACRSIAVPSPLPGASSRAHPGDRFWATFLTEDLEQYAGVERAAGHADSAQQAYAEVCAVLEPFASDATDTVLLVRLGACLTGEARRGRPGPDGRGLAVTPPGRDNADAHRLDREGQ